MQAANACNGFPSGADSCYVFTDSGTYHYLASGTDPAGTIPALKIVSQNNAANAPGGQFELINYFHGYIINPSKPGQTVNLPAAQDFLNYITSPAVQAQVGAYLASQGSPFKPTASPFLTTPRIPSSFVARSGRKINVSGTLTNAQPGFPTLSGEPVSVSKIVNGLAVQVATAKTNSSGGYSVNFVPPTNGSYAVTTNQISKVEIPSLSPVFGDLLSPASTTPAKVTVHSIITTLSSTDQGGQALIRSQVSPDTGHVKATATLFAKQFKSKKGFRKVATVKLATSDANFASALSKLAKGTWLIRAQYSDPGQVVAAPNRTIKVKVSGKPKTSISFGSVKVGKGGKLTVAGKIKPGAPSGKATVEVLAMKTAGGPPKFGEKATVKVKRGKTKFTAHFKVKTGFRWVIRMTNNQKGQSTSDTGLRTVNVK